MEDFDRTACTKFAVRQIGLFQFSVILNQRLTQSGHWLHPLLYKVLLTSVVHLPQAIP